MAKDIAGLVFVGCLFCGGAIGMALDHAAIGGAAGMGVGFLAMALVKYRLIQQETEPVAK